MDAGDAHLSPVADQDRRAGIASDAAAAVQHQRAAADVLAQLAMAIGGHGVPAVLAVAREHGFGAARRGCGAELERDDLVRQRIDQREHHPVRAVGVLVLLRVEARADLVHGHPRMHAVVSAAVAGEEMQR